MAEKIPPPVPASVPTGKLIQFVARPSMTRKYPQHARLIELALLERKRAA